VVYPSFAEMDPQGAVIPFALASSEVWDTAKESATVGLLPRDEAEHFRFLYQQMEFGQGAGRVLMGGATGTKYVRDKIRCGSCVGQASYLSFRPRATVFLRAFGQKVTLALNWNLRA
jgi:hypothetical protein